MLVLSATLLKKCCDGAIDGIPRYGSATTELLTYDICLRTDDEEAFQNFLHDEMNNMMTSPRTRLRQRVRHEYSIWLPNGSRALPKIRYLTVYMQRIEHL